MHNGDFDGNHMDIGNEIFYSLKFGIKQDFLKNV